MINSNFAIVGAVIGLIGLAGYVIAVIKGKAKPNRVSFICWALAPLIIFFAQIKQGVGIQALVSLTSVFACLLILAASFFNKKSEWKLNAFDVSCGVVSIIGLILWLVTRTGNIAIIFSIFADIMAAIPTIRKSFRFPETENSFAYGTGIIQCILTIFTIKNWNFATWGFPIYLLLLDILIFSLVQFKLGKVVEASK
jgi:hypothetical protein